MMFRENDYRFCVNAGLSIMLEQRKKLTQDSVGFEPTIYSGLHTSDSSALRGLYFQSYFVEWISAHWEKMFEILDNHSEYSVDTRREMILFFAEYFSDFLSECSGNSSLSKLAVPELLKMQKQQVKEMIRSADKWEQNSNRLRVQMKKNKEQYLRLIQEEEKNLS